jgi:preprotein translocase subunit YajC
MLINSAFAASEPATQAAQTAAQTAGASGEAFMLNMGLILVLMVMFYFLLIRPQQRRFKEHADMLNQLGKGDKVVTQGGLVGTIEKVVSDHEVLVDFGNGIKMTTMRSAIMGKYDELIAQKVSPANDDKKSDKEASSK